MKQVLQNLRTGELSVHEVARPALPAGSVLVANKYSLISAGTERTMTEFARKSLWGKARQRPDLTRQVIQKIKQEGIISTLQKSMARLDQLSPLGYSSAGIALEADCQVSDVRPQQRVACAGADYACHAEIVAVPRNLCVPVPEAVPLQHACFVTLGAIAMHGVRNAGCSLGDEVAVIGLGLIGLLTVQICKAAGCRVLAIDPDSQRVQMARNLGADMALVRGKGDVAAAFDFPHGHGMDAVIITAATTTNDPIELAGQIARDRARVSAVGQVGLEIPRKLYYEKELELVVSRSSGPGRYDPHFEEKGLHYPAGYVHWVERRNMEHFLQLVAEGKVKVAELISEVIDIQHAEKAYQLIGPDSPSRPLAVLLEYPQSEAAVAHRRIQIAEGPARRPVPHTTLQVGIIGAGQFARGVLLPALRKVPNCRLRAVATATGASGKHTAEKFGADYTTTDYHQLLADEQIAAILIATRHHLHAGLASEALQADKAVFVEKPLAITPEQLAEIAAIAQHSSRGLMVGFNRRFSSHSRRAYDYLAPRQGPLTMNYRVNAGPVESDSWILDPEVGGGRVIGEVCHFVDLLTFFADCSPQQVQALQTLDSEDPSIQALLSFADGSVGTITYATAGDETAGKERIELYGGGATVIIDDFSRTTCVRDGHRQSFRSRGQDKGHYQELCEFVAAAIAGTPMPIALQQLIEVHEATLAISRG